MKQTYLKPTMIIVRLKPTAMMQQSLGLKGGSASVDGGAYNNSLSRGRNNFWDDDDE